MNSRPHREVPVLKRKGVFVTALVDESDYDRVAETRWYVVCGYAARTTSTNSTSYMHRELLQCERGDGLQVDHINRDPLDNRRINLRLANNALNRQNTAAHYDGSSRFRGVSWDKHRRKWEARVKVAGRTRRAGRFDSEEEAGRAAAELRAKLMVYATD